MRLNKNKAALFQKFIWEFYEQHRREFAWRHTNDPYAIVVSEVMLQQTQTYRVIPKYDFFMSEFPSFFALAQASLRDVLAVWQGLGYNRRALFLQKIAQKVVHEYNGHLPADPEILQTFPGIGPATASSICAFAFNLPTVFIETNIRAVFIHLFFRKKDRVSDKEILPLVEKTFDKNNPREWYYALMDYGAFLKQQYPNPSRKSKHYTTQSRFEDSDRQIRGAVLKLLINHQSMNMSELLRAIQKEPARIKKIVEQLCCEGFIKQQDNEFMVV